MSPEPATEQQDLRGDAPDRPRCPRTILKFSFIATGAAAIWMVTWLAIASTIGVGAVSLNLIVPSACVILFGLIILRQEQTWAWPVKRLAQLLPKIHAGELPIDALNDIDGGCKNLAAQIRAVLHDLRSQKTRVAEIMVETQQRVANRTDALERTIGSLRQQATRDPLTTLYNRRMLDQFLPGEIDKCSANDTNLAVLMIDVDHFKVLNDTLGHAAGDQLLRDIGQIVRSSIGSTGAAFRNGGDEFVVVLPDNNEAEAEVQVARIKSLVNALVKPLRVNPLPAVSIGICTLSEVSEPTAHRLLEQADKRLYEHKTARKPLAKAS